MRVIGFSRSVSGAIIAGDRATLILRASRTALNSHLVLPNPELEYDQLLELRKLELELLLTNDGYEGGLRNYMDILQMAGQEQPSAPKQLFSMISLLNNTIHISASLEKQHFEDVSQFAMAALRMRNGKLWFGLSGTMTHGGISVGVLTKMRSLFLSGEIPAVVQAQPAVGFDSPEYQEWEKIEDSEY